MTTNSPETQSAPEVTETLEQRLERLEKENAELRAENEKLKSKTDQWNLREEIVVNRLYGFWKLRLNKAEVDNTLKNLNGEHKTKIEDFIKNNEIEDLQKYKNSLIDSWTINKDQLVNNCNEKWIWLRDWHISEDWKFWPQTFEAIKILAELPEWWNETPATGWNEWNGNEAPIPQDNQVEFSWELPNGIAKELVKYVNDNLANELAMGNENLVINGGSPNWANFSLSTWLPSVAYASVQYSINLKKCINNDWSIATDYVKNTLLPMAKDNLKQQKKAVMAVKWNLLKGKEYSMDDIFWDDEEVKGNLVLKTRLENYFNIFDDKKVTFDLWNYDDDTKFDNWNIKLTLDNDGSNKDYNKWRNNPDILIFPAEDIINDDYSLNEARFKEKLKEITRAIAEKEKF